MWGSLCLLKILLQSINDLLSSSIATKTNWKKVPFSKIQHCQSMSGVSLCHYLSSNAPVSQNNKSIHSKNRNKAAKCFYFIYCSGFFSSVQWGKTVSAFISAKLSLTEQTFCIGYKKPKVCAPTEELTVLVEEGGNTRDSQWGTVCTVNLGRLMGLNVFEEKNIYKV